MEIGFVLFPKLTQLDLTGPLQVFNALPGARCHLLSLSMTPIETDTVLMIPPTGLLPDVERLDLICVPGGFGVSDACRDADLVRQIAMLARHSTYVTSVCTGAFILGKAGLLVGRRATTHWAYHSLLSSVGALPTQGRVVRDGNVFTGGGVTAGIDFAFSVIAELKGPQIADLIRLGIEYDPAPAPRELDMREDAPGLPDALAGHYAARRVLLKDALGEGA
jgi:cyclohexyl-isocyanide hydratase